MAEHYRTAPMLEAAPFPAGLGASVMGGEHAPFLWVSVHLTWLALFPGGCQPVVSGLAVDSAISEWLIRRPQESDKYREPNSAK